LDKTPPTKIKKINREFKMKKFLIAFLAIISFSALAGEITLYNKPTSETRDFSFNGFEFGINKDLGRAWVIIKLSELGDGPVAYDERVKVEGLSYNPTSQEVLLDVEGTQIVCAKVKYNFFGTRIKKTCRFTFKKNYYTKELDNGY
jgi:hypothetical protein